MTLRRSNSLDDGGDLFLGCSGMTCLECTADRESFVEDVFNRGMHMPHFVAYLHWSQFVNVCCFDVLVASPLISVSYQVSPLHHPKQLLCNNYTLYRRDRCKA